MPEPGSIFIGGESAAASHIRVRADLRSGRTKEQMAKILQRVMQETSDILHIPRESMWVYVSDIPAECVAEYDVILPQVGGEKQWLAGLSEALGEKLQGF